MKLPSIKHLISQTSHTFFRFPGVLLSACVGALAAIILIEKSSSRDQTFLNNLIFTSSLGLPLFTAICTFVEKKEWSNRFKVLSQFIGAAILMAYFFSLPENVFKSPNIHIIRYLLLNIGLHFLVAFAPFTGSTESNGFWQFNKTLFLRFLTAALYSGVLYLGLSIAMLAVENLFGVKISGERYGQLWVFIAGIFNTWFFLAGIPPNLSLLNKETDYPKGLKIFTQYVLISLVIIYLIILYGYALKIIINWNWPRGWVANLILGFSVAGILSLLLVHPIREQAENKWIRRFSKLYYIALTPLVVMLFLAIWQRITDYGITENRYFVFVQALALAWVVGYFIFSKNKYIKVIPITLCFLAFFSSFGPWGAFSISKHSQIKRLEGHLIKNDILKSDKIRKISEKVTFEDQKEISAIVSYLHDMHGVTSMQHWFEEDLQNKLDSGAVVVREKTASEIVSLMGLTYVHRWQSQINDYFHLSTQHSEPTIVSGYDYLIRNVDLAPGVNFRNFNMGHRSLTIHFDDEPAILRISVDDVDEIQITLRPIMQKLIEEFGTNSVYGSIPPNRLVIEELSPKIKAGFYISMISGRRTADAFDITQIQMDLLIGQNQP